MATDRAVQALVDVATSRMDGIEDRVRVLEAAEHRREGASTGAARVQPWVSTAIALAALAWTLTR